MGACCVARERNEFETLMDEFFNNMTFTNMSCENLYNLIISNLNSKNKFFEGDEKEFLKQFVKNYVVNGKNKDPEWTDQASNYFHLQFKEAKQKGFFNFLAIILLLCNDINSKSKYLIQLAKRFHVEVTNDKEISKTAFEFLLQSYIKFVSEDPIIFIGELTKKQEEFHSFFIFYFNESTEANVLQNFLSNYTDDQTIDLNDFIQKNYFKLNHSEIRTKLIESKPDSFSKKLHN